MARSSNYRSIHCYFRLGVEYHTLDWIFFGWQMFEQHVAMLYENAKMYFT